MVIDNLMKFSTPARRAGPYATILSRILGLSIDKRLKTAGFEP
jgi:hypothetical protein